MLTKHIAAIHNSAPLNSTQRKIMNIFLENALGDCFEREVYTLSLKDLMRKLGWSDNSKYTEMLKSDLKDLSKIQIEWNILNFDRKNKWISMQLLAEVSIENGYVSYAYPPTLKEMLFRPNIFARLDMNVQKLIKKKHSLVLWELISGDFCLKKEEKITTKWISYAEILRLNALIGTVYENRYADFLKRIIEPSISELNNKSDITVSYEVKRIGAKITDIRFNAEKKNEEDVFRFPTKLKHSRDKELKIRLESMGFNKRFVNSICNIYSLDEIENAIDVYKKEMDSRPIKYPVGFLKKALEEGWIIPTEYAETSEQENNEAGLQNHFDCLNEPEECFSLRRNLLNEIGYREYKTWFSSAQFRVMDNRISILVGSSFHKDQIYNKYNDLFSKISKKLNNLVIEICSPTGRTLS